MAGINKGKKIDIVVLDMPLLNTMKYKDLNGIESLISDLILQLLNIPVGTKIWSLLKKERLGMMGVCTGSSPKNPSRRRSYYEV